MVKPLFSCLFLENNNNNFILEIPVSKTRYKALILNLWVEKVSQITWSTFKRGRDIRDNFALIGHEGTDRSIYSLFIRKLIKALNEKIIDLIYVNLRIQALKAQVEVIQPKKR